MTIKKPIVAAAAFFAVVAMCWAVGLSPTSGDYTYASSKESTSSSSSSTSSASASTTLLGDEATILTFSLVEDSLDEISGYEVLSEFLPDGVTLEWTGKKLKAPKAGKVKYSTKEEMFVDALDSENPSGLSVKCNKKTGKVSGSFKVYVAKSETKLAALKAKFSGKIGQNMGVYVKGKRVATAVIE